MNAPIHWFHWSPADRAGSIMRLGLVPGSLSTHGEWCADYLSFCDTPSLAWALSGATARGQLVRDWHLWMTDSRAVGSFWTREANDRGGIEYRTSDLVAATDLWWVGSRIQGATERLRAS